MRSTTDFLTKLTQFKQLYSSEYGVERIGVFGSVARGEQKEDSDVDICVEMKKPDMFLLVELKEKLQNTFGSNVDVVRLRENMNPFLLNRIKKEALYV
ncbi:MAG: nucleotidyltransferase domain-containing protein [Bacteroidetes bacterium]|nr:nucleotidyltransferase domain-containing protein [Bacteroidota bacterium]